MITIIDYPDRITDRKIDPELLEKLEKITRNLIREYKPVIIINGKILNLNQNLK